MNILDGLRRSTPLWIVVVALTATTTSRPSLADESSTAADAAALCEFAIASPELAHMNDVLAVEMHRILDGTGGKPSPEAKRYADAAALDLGDTRIYRCIYDSSSDSDESGSPASRWQSARLQNIVPMHRSLCGDPWFKNENLIQ